MEFRILESINKRCIYKNTFSAKDGPLDNLYTNKVSIEEKTYTINIEEIIFEGAIINKIAIVAPDEFSFVIDYNSTGIDFLYCLEGHLLINKAANEAISLEANNQFISSQFLRNKKITINRSTQIILIQLESAYFNRICSSTIESEMNYFKDRELSYNILTIICAISNCQCAVRVKKIFLESKIYELIFSYLNRRESLPITTVKKEDLDKIFIVKNIIDNDIQSSFSLLELARSAGINDFKLKKGFKQLTGETVFSYITKVRMQKAHHFLANDKMAVNEVAYLIGYKNAQHFTAAFKRYYKVLPGSLNRLSFSKNNV